VSEASTARIRKVFPALKRTISNREVAYFDGPGGTQVPEPVVNAMADYLYNHNANTHWEYPASRETDEMLAHARMTFSAFLNCRPDEVVFGANMTTMTFRIARALGRRWKAGDQLLVTELDHHGNIDPWRALADDFGIVVKTVKMIPETGQLDWDHFESLMSAEVRLVAVGAASNALGTISDVKRAVTLAHDAGALAFVDGVHYAPHYLPNVQALDADFFACSPYKFYGPHLGVVFGKHDLMQSLEFKGLVPQSHDMPERPETGTLNHEGIVGAAAAVEWLGSLAQGDELRSRLETAYQELDERSTELFKKMWAGLSGISGVTLYGPEPGLPRTSTVGFTVNGVSATEVNRRLAEHAIFASHGDFYAYTVVERLGLLPEGLVRAGLAAYTNDEEVTRLLDAVAEIAG